MGDKVEFFTSDGEHIAYMTLEEVVPEPGEDSFMWPAFTELRKPEDEEYLLDIVGSVEVFDENMDYVDWEDEDYLEYMVAEFRPGALTAVLL
jgi:hypothetical protein